MEAGGGQGENAGVGVLLLLVYGSVFCQPSGSRRWSGRNQWGGSVTVISMRESGRECWGGSVTVISILLCVLSAKWKQEGSGRK